jgi:hypothetical protein
MWAGAWKRFGWTNQVFGVKALPFYRSYEVRQAHRNGEMTPLWIGRQMVHVSAFNPFSLICSYLHGLS